MAQVFIRTCSCHVQMKVTGSNLQNACKLVFTLSKDEHNDPHFAKEGIVGEQDNTVCMCTVCELMQFVYCVRILIHVYENTLERLSRLIGEAFTLGCMHG